ncbi:MAG: hypothetical protein WC291_02400 [Thermodesulfovibrionales bacterium]|jgi:hypothetical protein
MRGPEKRLLSITVILSLCFLFTGCGPRQFRADLFQANEMTGWGPEGLTWNGRDLVLGSGRTVVFLSSLETGAFVNAGSFYNSDGSYIFSRDPLVLTSSRPIEISGSAWEAGCCGEGFLWIANSPGKEIIKVSMKNEILTSIPFPGELPGGLAFDGKDLWAADSLKATIYRISTEGKILQQFPSPVSSPTGLAWDCGQLWITGIESCTSATRDCNPPRLVRINPRTESVTREIPLPRQISRPASLEWVKGNLWVGDRDLNRVFRIPDSEPAPPEAP